MVSDFIRHTFVGIVLLFIGSTFLRSQEQSGSGLTKIHVMHEARASHTATLLPSGKVLIAGGFKKGPDGYSQMYFSSAEIYDPDTRTFTETGKMKFTRCGHTATLLSNGKVLVAGGYGDSGLLSSAELYDPPTGKFSPLPDMHSGREGLTATLLPGGKVLLAGGGEETITATAEIFDPETNTFSPTGSMHHPRAGHAATPLNDGKVLMIGGEAGKGNILSSDEIYDPVKGTFTDAGNMSVVRYKHAAVALPDGEVLILGGSNDRDWRGKYNSAEIFDPRRGSFSTIDTMHSKRFKFPHALAMTPSGDVVIAGGGRTVEIYSPKSKTFVIAAQFDEAHYYGTATLLKDGSVLVAGGYNDKPQSTNSAWVFR